MFALTMASFLVLIDRADKGGILQQKIALAFAVAFIAFAIVFAAIETFWAENPLIPPGLIIKQRAGPCYAIQVLLLTAQFSVSSI